VSNGNQDWTNELALWSGLSALINFAQIVLGFRPGLRAHCYKQVADLREPAKCSIVFGSAEHRHPTPKALHDKAQAALPRGMTLIASTLLKGLSKFDIYYATLSGLACHPVQTQGRRQNAPPTLGFVMQRLRRWPNQKLCGI
jgi:hypothetical protein